MKAYSLDFRNRVLALCDAGKGTHEVSKMLAVSESWIRRLKQRRREEGRVDVRPSGGRRHGHFEALRLSQLEEWVRQHPDATLEALRDRVADQMALHCSLMAVCRALRKLGWSLKKKRCGPASAIVPTCSAIAQTSSSLVGSQARKASCFSMNPGRKPT